MSGVGEAAILLRAIAGEPERPVKVAIARATARVSRYWRMSFGRIEDIWREEARLVRSEEMDAIRLAEADWRRRVEAGRAEAKRLAGVYLGAAERLRSVDEDFHRDRIAHLERLAREICPADRAGAEATGVALAASGKTEAR